MERRRPSEVMSSRTSQDIQADASNSSSADDPLTALSHYLGLMKMEGRGSGEEISRRNSATKRKASDTDDLNVQDNTDSGIGKRNFSIGDALSCYPVLSSICRMMNEEDLVKCSQVNKYWRNRIHLMMSNEYEIQMGRPYFNCEKEHYRRHEWVLVKKRDRHNPEKVTQYETTLCKILQGDLQSRKVSISLNMDAEVHLRGPRVKNFFSKLGNLVVELDYFCLANLSINVFCMVLLEDLPSLQNLNFSARFHDTDLPSDPKKPAQATHKNLKKITLGSDTYCRFDSLAKLLRLAPNLEEIHMLPIWLINAAVYAGKGPVLKSVCYNYEDNLELLARSGLTALSAFEKLAELQPTLTTFCVLPSESSFEEGTSIEMIKPFVISILKSSADSLQSFEISVSDWPIFQNCVPQLKNVKTVIFDYPSDQFEEERFSFPNISLSKIFPNASEMEVRIDLDDDSMNRYLPKNVLSPWGSQIKKLLVGGLPPSSVPFLQRIFPNIQHLQFSGSATRIAELLPALAKFWPQLKSLSILLETRFGHLAENLDCAFTGLSESVLTELLLNPGKFTEAQIQSLKTKSPLLQFRELKQLTIKQDNVDVVSERNISVFTEVTNEFAFKLLPHLKVAVGIWKNAKTWKGYRCQDYELSAG